MEDTYRSYESWQVLFIHFKAYSESPSAYPEAAEDALYLHVAPSQVVFEVLLLSVQLQTIGLHPPRQEGVRRIFDERRKNHSITNDKVGDPRSIAPIFHQHREQRVADDVNFIGAAHPASKDVNEVAMVVDDADQDDGEVALTVDECLGSMGWAEDEDVGAIHGPHIVREAHVVTAGFLLWVD